VHNCFYFSTTWHTLNAAPRKVDISFQQDAAVPVHASCRNKQLVPYYARLHFRRAPVFRHSSKNERVQLRALAHRDATSGRVALDRRQGTVSGFGDASLNASCRIPTRNKQLCGMWLLASNNFSSGGNLYSYPKFHRKTAPTQQGDQIKNYAVVNKVFRFPTEFPSQT
jgi:hypothetical protein